MEMASRLSTMLDRLSDPELHERTILAAKTEKRATLFLLEHLLETDRRRSYLPRYRTLWEYVERGLNYSSEQTNERMMALRFFRKLPEAKAAVAAETLCLTSAARIGSVIHRSNASAEDARELFRACDGKSTREVKALLLPNEGVPRPDSVRPIAKNLTLIKIEVGPDFMATLERAKELSGEFGIQALLQKTLSEFVRRREVREDAQRPVGSASGAGKKRKKMSSPERRSGPTMSRADGSGTHAHESEEATRTGATGPTTAESVSTTTTRAGPTVGNIGGIPELPAEHEGSRDRYIPRATIRRVRLRSGDRCEYIDPDRNRCDARVFLQFHHLNPYSYFGGHHPDNLMHVCSAHHAWIERRSGPYAGRPTVSGGTKRSLAAGGADSAR